MKTNIVPTRKYSLYVVAAIVIAVLAWSLASNIASADDPSTSKSFWRGVHTDSTGEITETQIYERTSDARIRTRILIEGTQDSDVDATAAEELKLKAYWVGETHDIHKEDLIAEQGTGSTTEPWDEFIDTVGTELSDCADDMATFIANNTSFNSLNTTAQNTLVDDITKCIAANSLVQGVLLKRFYDFIVIEGHILAQETNG